MPFNVFKNPRGGLGSPRGSGRGRGDAIDRSSTPSGGGRNLSSKLRAGAPLSRLLYEDRPFLKPVVFVRSVHTATLFENEEDIFQSVAEAAGTYLNSCKTYDVAHYTISVDGDEESHVPTADAVFRVFHPLEKAPEPSGDNAGEEQLEEIDFADIGKIQAQVDAAAASKSNTTKTTSVHQESASFFFDTTPSSVTHHRTDDIRADRVGDGALGEATEEDDEVIVYVAPHPRKSKLSPAPTEPAPLLKETLPSTSVLTGVEIGSASQSSAFTLEMGTLYPEPEQPKTPSPPPVSPGATIEAPKPEELPVPTFGSVSFSSLNKTTVKKQSRRLHPVGAGTPRSLLKRNRKARRKSLRGFGAFGAMHEEAMLHKEDPRRAEQRRGDSDVNFGSSDEEDVDALSVDMGGMELDDGIDLTAMKRFVHSMSAEGSRHVTMDDVADMERMKLEDEEEDERGPESAEDSDDDEEAKPAQSIIDTQEGEPVDGTDEEVEVVVQAEERALIGETAEEDVGEHDEDEDDSDEDEDEEEEGDDDDDDDSDSPDDDETPRRGFQARLERLRASSSKGKGKAKAEDFSDDDAMSIQMTWADEDEDYLEHIEVRCPCACSVLWS